MKRTIMYIFIAIIIVALVFSVGLLKEKDNGDSNLKTIQLNEVTRSVFYAPQYVAIENGYFEEQGLKLEITTGQGADKVMTAILAGQSDIGLCGPEAAIYVYNEGKEDYVEVFDRVFHTSIPFFLEFVKLVKNNYELLNKIKSEALIIQSDADQVLPLENGKIIYEKISSKEKYLTYIKDGRHAVFEGNEIEDERKKEIAEYIRLFLRGGYKWKKIWKEKI